MNPAPIALVLANLIPLAGVLFWEWQVLPLVLLFWLENLVIGLWTLARMLIARGDRAADLGERMFLCAFFTLHFGGFCFGHGVLLFSLFDPSSGALDFNPITMLQHAFALVQRDGLWIALAALVLSHGVSYVTNYLLPGTWRSADGNKLMSAPYARVVVLHIALLGGAFAVDLLGQPKMALTLLVALKIAFDLAAHLRASKRPLTA